MPGGARGEGREEVDGESEEDNKEAFVELCGMASEAVAEIDGPRKRRDGAIGAVSEAREKTADATEGGANGERPDEGVAGGAGEAEACLGKFDTGPAAEESAHDGFAAEERPRIGAEERGVVVGRLGPREEFGTGPRAENAADQEPEILLKRKGGLAGGATGAEVESRTDEVTEAFEDEMRVETQTEKIEVDGKGHRAGAKCRTREREWQARLSERREGRKSGGRAGSREWRGGWERMGRGGRGLGGEGERRTG